MNARDPRVVGIAKQLGTTRGTVRAVRKPMTEAQVHPVFQVMPDLTEEEFRLLKADIEARGILVPVEYDDEGHVLDGHHRVKAAKELGITSWPRLVRKGLTDEGKRAHARALNLARRHLTQAQRRELIDGQLKDTPQQSDRQIGASLGVDHKTISAAREELVARGEIPHVAERIDTKGRKQPASKPKTEKPQRSTFVSEHDAAIANELPPEVRDDVLTGTKTVRQAITASLPEAPLATSDTPAFDPPSKPLTNNQRKFRVTEAIRTLATTDVRPDELQGLLKEFEYPEVTEFLDDAVVYLTKLKALWSA
jgi:ParB-like chromosome segregation protein Spo0J